MRYLNTNCNVYLFLEIMENVFFNLLLTLVTDIGAGITATAGTGAIHTR